MLDIPRDGDIDPIETQEWLELLQSVLEREGPERAQFILGRLAAKAREVGAALPFNANTPYVNTIAPADEERIPGVAEIEWRIRTIIRWNAMAMVVRANKGSAELGGHIASFASSATLYDVGFNHFWRADGEKHGGDMIFIQGHSAPGLYARAFMEGRLSEEQLDRFRREVDGGGLSSYPHPWLMPDFWRFPTVSMGLGPLMAIYQARFMRYLDDRGIIDAGDRKVWAFMGDGEMDEPESLGAISIAAREKLDNLIFVINCNLQRLDGPVRGNSSIIQELERNFRGTGWNVIKVLWGGNWDPLFMRDTKGILRKRMEECVDGEYQAFKSRNGAFVREHFFGKYPELKDMVADMSDDEIWRLERGGHDAQKVYAAYAAATAHKGRPTVILAKTVKGYGMGEAGEGQNITHQLKKMGAEAIRVFRDRFKIPVGDDNIDKAPYYRPAEDSPEIKYLRERREALGGYFPSRRDDAEPLQVPELSAFETQLKSTGEREISTTMAFVRILTTLVRDKNIGKRVVPIVADESRTFGMEGLFRQIGIHSSIGQLYRPEDSEQLMYYREDKKGQILQEGISEAGAFSSWIAAGTSYSNHGVPMIPFYIYYSMFGFQRIGDLAWAAGDIQARGFLLGGTAGRTTLNGEGLQHQDGHSHLAAATIPNCIAYDPTFSYEVAVIIHDGLRRMFAERENVYYYITVMNENYQHPALPEGAEEGIRKGLYLFKKGEGNDSKPTVQLLGCGTILREVIAAAELLEQDFGVAADIWSATSFNELRRDAMAAERWSLLHPDAEPRQSHVAASLNDRLGPVIAATDYMRTFPEQIRPYLTARFVTLGTDGYGRSDSRAQLRKFFEVNRHYVAVAALKALADDGALPMAKVSEAIAKYGIDPERPCPWTV